MAALTARRASMGAAGAAGAVSSRAAGSSAARPSGRMLESRSGAKQQPAQHRPERQADLPAEEERCRGAAGARPVRRCGAGGPNRVEHAGAEGGQQETRQQQRPATRQRHRSIAERHPGDTQSGEHAGTTTSAVGQPPERRLRQRAGECVQRQRQADLRVCQAEWRRQCCEQHWANAVEHVDGEVAGDDGQKEPVAKDREHDPRFTIGRPPTADHPFDTAQGRRPPTTELAATEGRPYRFAVLRGWVGAYAICPYVAPSALRDPRSIILHPPSSILSGSPPLPLSLSLSPCHLVTLSSCPPLLVASYHPLAIWSARRQTSRSASTISSLKR